MADHFIISCLIYLLLLFLSFPFCYSIDTINSTHPLTDGDLLISNGETFALGFFNLNNSTNRYVGIWYNKVPVRTIVWVANRDSPLSNSTGVLIVDDTGNLVLRYDDQKVDVWSTNVFSSMSMTSNCYGQLLDSGNLILFLDGIAVWQGFDYPTDTMLPNMKIGWDRKTGLNRFITSWKSADDPGTGEYSHKMDFDFVRPAQLILYRGATPVWRTGTWIGRGWSGISQMLGKYIFKISYTDNQDEVTFAWSLLNSSITSILVVTASGTVDRLNWNEADNRWVGFYSGHMEKCDHYNHCGSFGNCNSVISGYECECLPGFEPQSTSAWDLRDGSGGCIRKLGVSVCRAEVGFIKLVDAKIPDMSTARVDKDVGLKECESECLGDCLCMGYASDTSSDEGGCIRWYGDMKDTRQFTDWGQDLYIRVDATTLAQYRRNSKHFNRHRLVDWLVPSAAAVVLVIFAITWCMRQKRAMRLQHEGLLYLSKSSALEGSAITKEIGENGTNADFLMFDLSTLVSATGNFDPANKLGQGGFGPVYKGKLPDGQEIAVKRLSNSSGQGMEEFKNEVTLIAKLQHRNLVRLLGCCIQNDEKMLVYEYLQNKGLDYFIFDKERAALLDWRRRYVIVMGIVRGLLYLHQDSRLRIIHRDLKASNILLDASLNPKISDFGMARIVGGDQIEAVTNRVVGTYGYMSPEYAMEGMFSIKSDVFSLGVLLLEIVSGRRNNSTCDKENSVKLVGYVWELWRKGVALEIVDPSMGDLYKDDEVMRCIHVGLLCVQERAKDRPTMPEVAFMLSNEINLHSPNQPGFAFNYSNSPDSRSAKGETNSTNEATMTAVTDSRSAKRETTSTNEATMTAVTDSRSAKRETTSTNEATMTAVTGR